MNILILGGAGFIGQVVSKKLIENGHNVSLIVHKNIPEFTNKNKDNPRLFFGNILDKNSLQKAFKNQDIVINLVGQISNDKILFYNLNIIGGLNVLELCEESKIKNIVLISSCMVYGESGSNPSKESDSPNPMTDYSLTKFLTENIHIHFANQFDFNLSILRLSNIYGPDKINGIVYNVISAIDNNKEITIYNDGTQKRDYIYISDAVDGIIKILENLPKGVEIFNISTSTRTSLLEIISILEKQLSKKAMLKFVQDKTYNEQCIWADYTKAKISFDFVPRIDLDQGIRNTIINMKLKFIKVKGTECGF